MMSDEMRIALPGQLPFDARFKYSLRSKDESGCCITEVFEAAGEALIMETHETPNPYGMETVCLAWWAPDRALNPPADDANWEEISRWLGRGTMPPVWIYREIQSEEYDPERSEADQIIPAERLNRTYRKVGEAARSVIGDDETDDGGCEMIGAMVVDRGNEFVRIDNVAFLYRATIREESWHVFLIVDDVLDGGLPVKWIGEDSNTYRFRGQVYLFLSEDVPGGGESGDYGARDRFFANIFNHGGHDGRSYPVMWEVAEKLEASEGAK